MAVDLIRYDLLAQDALRGVVKKVLTDIAARGLPGDHHFFISFHTRADGVKISDRLRSVDYFTFLPDFVPASALRLLATVERRLERGPLGPYAAHFMTCHERLPGPVD
jgi:hypothetical protein